MEEREFSTISLPNNVQDAMRDNLPNQVSKLLREELEKGANAIAKNAELAKEIQMVEARLDEFGTIKAERRKLKASIKDCGEVLANALRERDLMDLTKCRIGLESAERYANKLETVLAGLVRNTEWRESIHQPEMHKSQTKESEAV